MVSSFLPQWADAARSIAPAALLVPLSGPRAALGRSMARAALLAQGPGGKPPLVIDTAGIVGGAEAAARQALKRGAGLILGPLFAADVRPVVAAVGGRVPVLSFSNDPALAESGVFLLGITPEQTVAPLVHYARTRGVRAIGIAGAAAPVVEAAMRAGQREGLVIATLPAGAALDTVDAILFAGQGATVTPAAARAAGVQPLVAFGGLDPSPAALAGLEGAWLSAPDPAGFAGFAAAFEAANGAPPGIIAGLAYDAATIAETLTRGGGTDRSALLAMPVFKGVCGDLRFRADGSASRTMAILVVEQGRYRVADRT